MINEHKLLKRPKVLALIQSEFEPGEEGIALCLVLPQGDAAKSTDILSCYLVLTNRYIRLMGFKINNLILNSATSIRTISSIKTMELKSLFSKELRLSFSCEGKEEIFLMHYVEGKAFVEKFREVVSNKDSSPTQLSMADELQKLAQLTKEGILSAEEYDRAKNRLIGVSPSQVDEATKLLRQLHELRVQGVLSESEFNMKKWDVLSHRLIPKDKSS